MLSFTPLTIEHHALLRRYYDGCDYHLCEYSTGTKLMWSLYLRPSFAQEAGCLIVRNRVDGEWVFDFPVPGPSGDVDAALTAIEEYCTETGTPPVISVVPEEKAPELLREAGCGDDLIRAVCSHGYGICCDIEPTHQMEKVLYAADELTGLIGAAALMRPSKSCQDMEVKSLKKKYKDKKFAAGCSREVIERGAEMLGWDLDTLIEQTILAMRASIHVE